MGLYGCYRDSFTFTCGYEAHSALLKKPIRRKGAIVSVNTTDSREYQLYFFCVRYVKNYYVADKLSKRLYTNNISLLQAQGLDSGFVIFSAYGLA
jgi:hypothetical protein